MISYSNRFRKKYFVDPAVQGAIVRRLLLHWGYAMLTGCFCLLMLQVFTAGSTLSLGEHLGMFFERYSLLFATMILTLPLFIYDSLRLSHRFVGPMIAVRLALKKLAAGGSVPEITFRQGDFWPEIADDINTLARRIGEQNAIDPAAQATDAAVSPLKK